MMRALVDKMEPSSEHAPWSALPDFSLSLATVELLLGCSKTMQLFLSQVGPIVLMSALAYLQ